MASKVRGKRSERSFVSKDEDGRAARGLGSKGPPKWVNGGGGYSFDASCEPLCAQLAVDTGSRAPRSAPWAVFVIVLLAVLSSLCVKLFNR